MELKEFEKQETESKEEFITENRIGAAETSKTIDVESGCDKN